MDIFSDLISWLLIIIPAGGAMRGIYCLIHMAMDEDAAQYKLRLKNLLIFIVVAESFTLIFSLFQAYMALDG